MKNLILRDIVMNPTFPAAPGQSTRDRRRRRAARVLAVLPICVALSGTLAWAQTRPVDPKTVLCVYDGSSTREGLTELQPDTVIDQEVTAILNSLSLDRPSNLVLRPGTVENAAATFEPGTGTMPPRRVILYNQQYFILLPHIAGPWGRTAVLAHELGHHLNGHSETPEVDPQREIQADRFAGRVLAILGANLDEATAVLSQVSELVTRTHPGRMQRRAAMVNGWIQESPDLLIGPSLQARLSDLENDGIQRHTGEVIIDGTTLVDDRALIAEKIIFRPGARLVFSRKALARYNSFFVVAREITSDDTSPGTVSWERPVTPAPPGSPGQAGSGRHGHSDGENGAPGHPGASGAIGYPGEDAPSLILASEKIRGAQLLIDLEGHGGGPGSAGQNGGDGGNGQRGSHASSSFLDCRRGPGDGGAGGSGGPGGPGGPGGRGGRGGTFTLLTDVDFLPVLKDKVQMVVTGGEGGGAGGGGEGGRGGIGGPRGAPSLPFCRDDGRDGTIGQRGPGGGTGSPGLPGPDGQFAIGLLASEQIRSLITPL